MENSNSVKGTAIGERSATGGVCALCGLALVASSLHELSFGGIFGFSVHIDWFVYVPTIAIGVGTIVYRRRLLYDRTFIAACALLIVATAGALQVLWSTGFGIANFITKWLQLSLGLVLLLVIHNMAATAECKCRLLKVLVGWGAVAAALGLYEVAAKIFGVPAFRVGLFGDLLSQLAGRARPRPQAVFSEPAIFGSFMAICLVGVVGYIVGGRRQYRQNYSGTYKVIGGLLAVGVLVSGSISAYITAIGGILFVKVLAPWSRIKINRWMLGGTVALATYIVLISGFEVDLGQQLIAKRVSSVLSVFGVETRPESPLYSIERRGYALVGAWRVFIDNPLLGVGLNQIELTTLVDAGGFATYEKAQRGVPNIFFQAAGEMGVFGLLSLSAIWWTRLSEMRRQLRNSVSDDAAAVLTGWLGVAGALVVSALFNRPIIHPLYWVVLGITGAAIGSLREE